MFIIGIFEVWTTASKIKNMKPRCYLTYNTKSNQSYPELRNYELQIT